MYSNVSLLFFYKKLSKVKSVPILIGRLKKDQETVQERAWQKKADQDQIN